MNVEGEVFNCERVRVSVAVEFYVNSLFYAVIVLKHFRYFNMKPYYTLPGIFGYASRRFNRVSLVQQHSEQTRRAVDFQVYWMRVKAPRGLVTSAAPLRFLSQPVRERML